MAKMYIRSFVVDTPQWNGESFVRVSVEEESRLIAAGVAYDAIQAKSSAVALGRYAGIGYGQELPDSSVMRTGWVEIEASEIVGWPEDGEPIRL